MLHWFDKWAWTYDPRLVGQPGGAFIPFKPYDRQRDFLKWLNARVAANEPWVVQKSRDQGATYLLCGWALHKWLFVPGFKTTFGSRVEDLVDNRDNPDAIFEKLRIILRRLPQWMLPKGFSWHSHDLSMRLINPANGGTITGEGGKNMGRGGRSSVYILDECAFVEHPESAESAITGTTDCIGYVSTVNRAGDFFDRKRLTGTPPEQIFELHWRDDPRKKQDWADKKKASLTDPTAWEREYEINSDASADNICIPSAWVKSAQWLAKNVALPRGKGMAGGDVGGGKAKSILSQRFGPVVLPSEMRTEADTTDTAYWMLRHCVKNAIPLLNYDVVGIGAGVLSTMTKAGPEYASVKRFGINTGLPASKTLVWPDKRTSFETFKNTKAELWWLARTAFNKTHEHVLFLQKQKGGKQHPLDELIGLPDDKMLTSQLSLVKWFHDSAGKIIIESKEQLSARSIPSPDYADAFVLTFRVGPGSGIENMDLSQDDMHRDNPWNVGGGGDHDGFETTS